MDYRFIFFSKRQIRNPFIRESFKRLNNPAQPIIPNKSSRAHLSLPFAHAAIIMKPVCQGYTHSPPHKTIYPGPWFRVRKPRERAINEAKCLTRANKTRARRRRRGARARAWCTESFVISICIYTYIYIRFVLISLLLFLFLFSYTKLEGRESRCKRYTWDDLQPPMRLLYLGVADIGR